MQRLTRFSRFLLFQTLPVKASKYCSTIVDFNRWLSDHKKVL